MRRAVRHDTAGVYRVCRLTGDSGQDASALHADPDLLGHVWAGPYLVAPNAVAQVVQDDRGVAGYCVAVPDTAAFERWLEAEWLPPLRAHHPPGTGATAADAALVRRLHHWPPADPALVASYPAHLHVDLLPRLQGQGWGRRLVEAVLGELAAGGVPGVHLGVGAANHGALGFYPRLGFTEAGGDEHARVFVRRLAPGR